ncbi:MAG: hypothetical protein COW01_06060 [Bdellovibrionales bacterium CG12_big_fil_rev_8_21_14_0_65_38_15]|nr:MAG: hypothetical protein COW79_03955 [Bdellovibrionales bacterium CG22_combo_CG10-13_8_21_14_all_38_13]PIQ55995.1 MAG: hypothetical protein COW01_06060 [Bdellovibrionales bacterium CG12_big_fil_rev_8_21_14_0_65_38_15]PIR30600.1 MAG: hypothetical protein COV38_04600 [Bdellovibrionales bacterium CG11_big_fil_rev_8_21_14_0_20_38_13]
MGAAILAVSYFKISSYKNISNIIKKKYWMNLGKTVDSRIYKFLCTIVIPLIILIKFEVNNENVFYIIPIIAIAILINIEKRVK